jgi:peptidoglycan L-alanyl-D-glutamate endopeptidase CwlK
MLPQNEEKLKDLQPEFANLVKTLIHRVKRRHGIDLYITEGYRSFDRQKELYEKGRTKPGKVVTYARPGWSFHNYGLAVDVVPWKDGKAWWDAPLQVWEAIGKEAKALGMIWGGDFKRIKDFPHIEYHPGLSIADVYSWFQKTGEVLIRKTLNPYILLGLVIGAYFVVKWIESKLK